MQLVTFLDKVVQFFYDGCLCSIIRYYCCFIKVCTKYLKYSFRVWALWLWSMRRGVMLWESPVEIRVRLLVLVLAEESLWELLFSLTSLKNLFCFLSGSINNIQKVYKEKDNVVEALRGESSTLFSTKASQLAPVVMSSISSAHFTQSGTEEAATPFLFSLLVIKDKNST